MTNSFTLVFSTSYAWQSAVIRWLCHSPFSHCDLLLPEPAPYGLFGSSDPGGVTIRRHDYQKFKVWHKATIKTRLAGDIINLALSQKDKPFDKSAMWRVMSTEARDWKLPDAWFCSELFAWACETAGLFQIVAPKNRITPADLLLLLNPWIDPVEFWKTNRPIHKQDSP